MLSSLFIMSICIVSNLFINDWIVSYIITLFYEYNLSISATSFFICCLMIFIVFIEFCIPSIFSFLTESHNWVHCNKYSSHNFYILSERVVLSCIREETPDSIVPMFVYALIKSLLKSSILLDNILNVKSSIKSISNSYQTKCLTYIK
jgi:hypothetical protein